MVFARRLVGVAHTRGVAIDYPALWVRNKQTEAMGSFGRTLLGSGDVCDYWPEQHSSNESPCANRSTRP